MAGHVYIDLTTLSCWRGPPVGIARCQERYARYAFDNISNARFTLFDPELRRHRSLHHVTAGRLIEGSLKVDTTALQDLNAHRHHFVDYVPKALQPLFWWITKPRRRILAALEKIRLSPNAGRLAGIAERLQPFLMKDKDRHRYYDADGKRLGVKPLAEIGCDPVDYRPDDISIGMQSDWIHTDIAAITALKDQMKWRHVVLCHDLIPILFPHWYDDSDVEGFRTYYDIALKCADRVMFTSNCTARDAARHAGTLGFTLNDHAVVPMGSDIAPAKASTVSLPSGLEPGKFAMFVSTIEPRKNHRLLAEAWRGLARSGLIAKTGFKLVFVGRPGWKIGSLLEDLAADPLLKGSLLHLQNIDDGALARLYLDAAFCLYPPLYEGFGLPIIEALAHGKPLLVSNAGPMPEIAGDFAVPLDPENPIAWQDAMRDWIENPGKREALAAKVRNEYQPLSWTESARQFFDKALAPFPRG